MIIYTIGFTKTSAENFFSRIRSAEVELVMDVRLKADSQLSGFAKKQDLGFFLNGLLGVKYKHEPLLAPTGDMLDAYKKGKMSWTAYEREYLELLASREVAERLMPVDLDKSCFLCSEAQPHHCHRRLAAEYLSSAWGGQLQIRHL